MEANSEFDLQIQLFGAFDVRVNGISIPPLRSRKVQWLLALLVLRHNQALDRVWLAGTLWPESAPAQSLYNLRQSLSNLRHALGGAAPRLHASMVNALSLDLADAAVDVVRFDAAVAVGDTASLERAIALYRGPLLEGCGEEWVVAERRVREESYLNALHSLAETALERGEGNAAINYLRAAVQVDPYRERTQRVLMQALTGAGDYAAAVQAYRDLRLLLRRELNADPDPETVTLFQHIRSTALHRRPAHLALPAMPRPNPACRLPSPLTPLIGRGPQVEEITSALRAARLLTLTGAGGVGKTRLAIAVGEAVAEEYPDGVFFVDLAPLSDAALTATTVAAVLQAQEEPGRSQSQTLQEHLEAKTLLLLIDNCEHLLDSCAGLIDAILRHCPGVRVLATSRQALGLTGEVRWIVPSLTTPALDGLDSENKPPHKEWLVLLGEYEAVQLFVTRAQQTMPAFRMSVQNAEAIARICVHLDGMPLALELAAARASSLSAEEINSRLNNRFRLLTGGSRVALPRQQTLRALMNWSYDLLTPAEKALLCRLAVFVGGWTLEAAEQVCAGKSLEQEEAFEEWEALDLLTSLVDKSLVMAEQVGASRYRLLETVRQYAQERAEASGSVHAWRVAHRDYFLWLAEEAQDKLSGAEQAEWLERLEAEHDNLRAALDFCLADPQGSDAGLHLAGALQQFWWMRGHVREGRSRLAAVLARSEAQTPARAKALTGAGSMAWMQGDYAAARVSYEESLTLGRKLEDWPVVASALANLGSIATVQSDYDIARAFFEESLTLRRDIGEKRSIANILVGLGNVAMEQGDYTTAEALGRESLTLQREMSDKRGSARSLTNLGNVAVTRGDYAVARPYYEESLALQREVGDKRGVARSLNNLGNLALEQGDYAAARCLIEESILLQRELGDKAGLSLALCNLGPLLGKQDEHSAAQHCLRECLTLCQELGEKWITAYALEGCAELVFRQRKMQRCVRLYGAACALRTAIGSPLPPRAGEEQARIVVMLRDEMGEADFLVGWAEGQAMALEPAIRYAHLTMENE